MVDKLPIPLQEHLLRTGGSVGQLVSRARERDRLLDRIRARLPAPLDRHCQGVERDGDTLCLVLSSPAWVARARYLLPQIEPAVIGLAEPAARSLRVRAARQADSGNTLRDRRSPPSGSGISPASRKQIRSSASHIRDPELRAALERLGREPGTSGDDSPGG